MDDVRTTARQVARAAREAARAIRKEAGDKVRALRGGARDEVRTLVREARGAAPAGRRRDAEATKQAILDAAREAFSHANYDKVGLREIARQAGVDVALVGRYFGSKEGLFGAVIRSLPRPESVAPPPDRSAFGAWLAGRLVDGSPKDPSHFTLIHHAMVDPKAVAVIRELIEERFLAVTTARIGGPEAGLRAALMLSHVTGFNMMHRIVGLEALVHGDRERMTALLGAALQTYIDAAPEAGA